MAVDTTGIGALYDALEAKLTNTLDAQWNSGRLTGSDYAQVLSSTLTEALQLSVKTVQEQPQVDANVALIQRQTKGFDDNMKQKMLEIQLNAWSLMFSSGLLTTSPALITNDEASTLYTNLKTELGI